MLLAILLAVVTAIPTRVSLSSQPAGAMVSIDGMNRGATPIMLFDLQPGLHRVTYRLNGYLDVCDIINTEETPIIDRSVILEEEKGLLLLKTEPEGCHIKIDGLSVGQTPRFIGTLSTKDTHTIKLSKPGYREQTLTVKFKGREPIVREETLMLDSAALEILSDPAGAEVMVNGIIRGKTPLSVKDIPKGTATIKLNLAGYRSEVRELRMNAGDRETLSVTMEGVPGTLHLLSIPARANFYVNGEARGKGPLTLANLKAGVYVVRCEAEGYAAQTREIKLTNGASVHEEFRLSNTMGKFDLRTIPGGADVFLDGHKVGQTRASSGDDSEVSDLLTIDGVSEGEHVVTVRRNGYLEAVRSVNVVARETTHVNRILLKRTFVPNIQIETVNGTFRGVYKEQNEEAIIIETKPGTSYPIPRQFVRKVEYLVN